MDHVAIIYAGAVLEIPAFLEPLWPHDMPLHHWPTFCGAGVGIGDWIVPDRISGVHVGPACLAHDLDWAIGDGSKKHWLASNERFGRNLKSLVRAQVADEDILSSALEDCDIYRIAVSSPVGWCLYDPCGTDPYTNPVVKSKLKRLAQRYSGIA